MKRLAWLLGLMGLAAVTAPAEPGYNRPYFCRENQQLDISEADVGVLSTYYRYDESEGRSGSDLSREIFTVAPYLRYGLLENLTAFANLPFSSVDSDRKGTKSGIGDVSFGLELLAYEYVFGYPRGYPYVLPYVEVILPTGDDEAYLGRGKTDAVVGASAGTTVAQRYHYVLDARYNVNYRDDDKGMFSLATAFIWDISARFSIMLEVKGTSEETEDENSLPFYFRGGMFYRATDRLMFSWYGGGSINADEDGMGALKIGYLF